MPKFGEWDVNNPASAEGFTVIFSKAKDDKKPNTNPKGPTPPPKKTKKEADNDHPKSVYFCTLPFQLLKSLTTDFGKELLDT